MPDYLGRPIQPFGLGGLLSQPEPQPLLPQQGGGLLGPALMNPNLARQGNAIRERQFLNGIQATPWFSEFRQQYGEAPDLSRNANYDYRAAWAAGIRPERDPYDGNRFHWPSALPNGEMLKAPDHPTAWKEHFMQATGRNPDAVGATQEDWLRMQQGMAR